MPERHSTYDGYIVDLSTLPFSFVYDEVAYTGFPAETFRRVEHRHSVQGKKTQNLFVLKVGDLQVTVDTAFYAGYEAYEWTVWFENTGGRNSGVIRNIRVADMCFTGERPVLKGILGDHENQYRPYTHVLEEAPVHFRSDKGRPTHVWFPYFNLEHGNGGTLIAIGWGGTWEAQFTTDGNGQTHFTAASTNDLCTYLKPGEKIRSALMSFVPYTVRNEDHATNVWRRWFLDCNLPKLNAQGDPVKPFSTTWLAGDTGIPNSDGSISERHFTWKPSLEKMFSEGIKIDYRWFDAGWYFAPDGNTVESDWWGTVGTWELDTVKWPGNSFGESVDFAHAHGMKTLVWFEPERVTHVDDLVKHYGYNREWAIECGAIANNIGNEECLQWTLGRILSFLGKYNVDMYREDNNCDPRKCWDTLSAQEGANRTGIVENKAVVAHYRMWDCIIEYCARTGKDTFVDSCASGGGRNDLESLRRGIPIMRSDADRTTTADFYLLTPWNGATDKTHWTSYVYFDPEKDSGVLFAFRMEEAVECSYSHRLTMLNPEHTYELRDADKGVIGTFAGSELAKGYTVTHCQPRSAALIYIARVLTTATM